VQVEHKTERKVHSRKTDIKFTISQLASMEPIIQVPHQVMHI